jgi:hypothetical protein
MRTVPAATPAETGKNKGVVQPYQWPTSIAADQNVTGLPTNKAGKVCVSLPGDGLSVRELESADECRQLAGENFDAAVLELFNARISAAQLARARVAFGKLTVAPSDSVAFAQSKIDETDLAAIFAPAPEAKQKKAGVTAQLAAVAANIDTMSEADLRAIILKLAGK